jgi:3-phosphoshikimate 1-carboxyvinyltransferase
MRAVPPLAALSGEAFLIEGRGSLGNRPVHMVEPVMKALGAQCATEGGLPPVRVRGPLRGGLAQMDGSGTSQFLSGLLMALPLCPGDSEIGVSDLRSRPYVAMTVECVRRAGGRVEHAPDYSSFHIPGGQRYRATDAEVEGDWSGGALLLVAGALAGSITVKGLSPDSLQADRSILEALSLAGAEVTWEKAGVIVGRDELSAFDFDATHCPDLFPPLAVLACGCHGTSRIAGAGRLRHKESDRAAALVEELGRIGGRLRVEGDILSVEGAELRGGEAASRGDHRIAMALAVAGLVSREGVRIRGEACVSKSYPGFFEALLGAVRREG